MSRNETLSPENQLPVGFIGTISNQYVVQNCHHCPEDLNTKNHNTVWGVFANFTLNIEIVFLDFSVQPWQNFMCRDSARKTRKKPKAAYLDAVSLRWSTGHCLVVVLSIA
jgi:hypothetical protein